MALRDARLYLAGQALSLLGDLSLSLAMGVWVKQLTGSSGAAGLTFVAFLLPQLASPLAGMIVDRTRRRPLLIAVNLASALAVAPLVLVHDAGDVWIVYAVSLALGASAMVQGAGQSALLVGLLPGELLAHGNAALQTLRESLRLLAPLAGAGLFAWLGGGAVAALDAGTFLAAAAALALMRLREPRPGDARPSRRGELGAGIAHVRATPVVRRLIAAGALAVVALGMGEAVLFAVVDDGLHRPPAFLGVLLAVQGAGAVAAGACAPAVMARVGERRGCALGMTVAAVGLPLLATSSLALVLAGAIVFGAGMSWILVGAVTLLQRSTPAHLQGRAYAVLEMALAVPQTAAVAVGAALVDLVDHRLLLLAMAALMAVAGVVLRRDRSALGRTRRVAPVAQDRRGDADDEGGEDDGQAGERPDLVQVLDQQLDPHEAEHDGDRLVQVAEAPDQLLDEGEQRAQSHEREGIRRPDGQRVGRDREGGGDRVHREGDVGRHDPDQREDHRGGDAPAVLAREEASPVVVLAHGQHAAHHARGAALPGVQILVCAAQDPPGEHQQRRAEDVDDPVEALDQLDAHEDGETAHHEREHDAPEQQLAPLLVGHREGAEDEQEDEEVVERQRALDQVDGQVVDRTVSAVERPQWQGDRHAEHEPADAPGRALAEAGLAAAGEEQQVDEQERGDDREQHGELGHALRLRGRRSRARSTPRAAAAPRTTSTRPRW
jgi:MFS family permease